MAPADKKKARPAKSAGNPKAGVKGQRKAQRLNEAAKVAFNLEPEVRALCAAEARAAGMDFGHLMQKIIENHVLATAAAGDKLAERLRAKRAVIDQTIATAQKIDAEGGFDEHFILTVMKTMAQDAEYQRLYEIATAAVANDKEKPGRARVALNQQLGRLIKKSVGAKSKTNEAGRMMRAQVTGEAISAYTLLVKPA